MFQSLFARDFSPARLYVSVGLMMSKTTAPGGPRLENDVPFKLPGTRRGRRSLVALDTRNRRLLLVRPRRYYFAITEPHASGNAN